MKRSWRSWRPLVIAAVSILALAGAYVLAAHFLLRSRFLAERLFRRPDRVQLTWEAVSSPWPGVVRARGVELRVQTGSVQWWLRAERAWGMIDLPALLHRELRFLTLRAHGVEVRVRRRPASAEEAAARAPLMPEIPGLAFTLREPPGPPRPASGRRPWTLRFGGVDLDPIRSFSFDEYRLRGDLAASGALVLRLRRSAALSRTRLEVARGELEIGGRAVAHDLTAALAGHIEEFAPRQESGWAVMPHVHANGRVEGRLEEVSFLNAYFSAAPWLLVDGGAGSLAVRVALRAGEFRPGSVLEVASANLQAALLDQEARGDGRLRWTVVASAPGKGEPEARALFAGELHDYALFRRGESEPHLHGESLRMSGSSRDLAFDGRLADLDLEVEMPDAEVPDLRTYNRYLPAAAGLEITGGSGKLEATLRAAWPEGRGDGSLRLHASDLAARFADLGLRGHLEVDARLHSSDLEQRVFDLAGTTVDLEDVALAGTAEALETADWWGRLKLVRGALRPGAPAYLDTEVEAQLRDSRPLLELFAARRPLPGWARRVLTVEAVGASARLRLGHDLVELDRFSAVGESVSAQARLRLERGGRRGALLATWGPLALGIELDGDERTTHIVGARQWYADLPPLR